MKKIFLAVGLLIILAIFFSYRILEVPPGLTVDEAAFGYNAALLSRTGYDENGRFLPFFVLSIEGKDWRQPITQYYITAFFKLFGASVFNLRFSSVVITIVSAFLIYFLGKKLLGDAFAIFASLVFLTTPLIMIQSHMALDNLMVIPFVILWLIFIYFYEKNNNLKFLILAGASLGLGFYSYKGMRAVVPSLALISIGYLLLIWISRKKKILSRKFLKTVSAFLLGILPFILIIPILHMSYPGAVFGGARPHKITWQEFFNPYISSFDPSFLYISGDATPYHSTGKHGMLLLASLPFFILGSYLSIKKGKFWSLILAAFALTPFLYGFTGSVHRASRLMAVIPFYSLTAGLGFFELYVRAKKRPFLKIFFTFCLILVGLNFYNFVKYYWFTYPKAEGQHFGKLEVNKSYKALSQEAKSQGLTPYISKDLFRADGEIGKFYASLYFPQGANFLDEGMTLPPKGSMLMTSREDIKGMNKSETSLKFYHLFTN